MQRDVILVLGQTGSGKSYWANGYAKTLTRVLVLHAGFQEYGAQVHHDFHSIAKAVEGKSFFRESYTPLAHEFGSFLDLARAVGPVHLFLEEAHRLGDSRYFFEYDTIVTQGRHWGVSIVALTTRPAKLPTDLQSQVTRLVSFRQFLPRDLGYIGDIVGDDNAEVLPSLPQFARMEWTPAMGARFFDAQNNPLTNL